MRNIAVVNSTGLFIRPLFLLPPMAQLSGRATAIIGGAVSLIVVLSVVGAVAGDLFASVADVNAAFDTNTTGDATGDTIAGVMPLIIAVTFVLGLAGLVISAVQIGKRGGF